MIIRKTFKAEMSHVVRNCSTDRCQFSIHGHSAIIEIKLECDKLDNGMMIMDFSLVKQHIGELIDSFDHCYVMWNKENQEFKDFIYKNSQRWIEMPVSPSAEALSLVLFKFIDKLLGNIELKNNEGNVKIHSVTYHETATGYAECFREDLDMVDFDLDDIKFSPGVKKEWKNLKL